MGTCADVLQKAQDMIGVKIALKPAITQCASAHRSPSSHLAPADRYSALWGIVAFLGESYFDFVVCSKIATYWPEDRKTTCKFFKES